MKSDLIRAKHSVQAIHETYEYDKNIPAHGLVIDSDFIGCGRPSVGGYLQPWNVEKPAMYNRAGILNGDRESAAIVTLANLFGRRGGSICSVADNIITGKKFTAGAGHNVAIDIALEGCAILAEMDRQKAEKQYWYPALGSWKDSTSSCP